jgi:hypothetical protein
MRRFLEVYRRHGWLAAAAINDGDWRLCRQYAELLGRAKALQTKDAEAARAVFADAYASARRIHALEAKR